MKFLNNSSIKTKLQVVIIGVALLTCASIYIGLNVYENTAFEKVYVDNLREKAKIITPEIQQALIDKDTAAVKHVLGSLKIQVNIISAAVYDGNGNLIASYVKESHYDLVPKYPQKNKWEFQGDRLKAFFPINKRNTGTIYFCSNVEVYVNRIQTYNQILLFIIIISIILSYLAARLVQNKISNPIINLSNTAKKIIETKDFSNRAIISGDDEIGSLSKSFNNMIGFLQKHEDEMNKQNTALLVAETRYRSTLDNMQEGCQIIGLNWEYLYLNDAACTHARKSLGEMLGKRIMDVYPGFDKTDVFKKMEKAMNDKIDFSSENEFTYTDGSSRIFSIVCEVIPEGLFIMSEDVTEKKMLRDELEKHKLHLEELVKERTAQLEAVNKELESFSYSVSHDLRAPLRHINGFTDLLRKNSASGMDEKGVYYLNVISDASKQMGMLIDDLLVFSRIGKAPLKIMPVNFSKLLTDTLIKLNGETEGRNINWEIDELPEVQADPSLFALVFQNLIGNALKYTRTRDEVIIRITCYQTDSEYIFSVKDNGVGFDMRYCDRLFGVFQRLHSSAEFEGTGIGLANVHRIITRHGGRIWACGEVDKGATFYFTIPKILNEGHNGQ